MSPESSEGNPRRDSAGELGSWIRSTRVSIDLSQREIASKAKISPSYLCDIELGRGGTPSLAVLDRLASALGVTKSELLEVAGVIERPGGISPTDGDSRMQILYRNLSPEGKSTVERFARFVLSEEHRWVQRSLIEEDEPSAPEREQPGPRLFD